MDTAVVLVNWNGWQDTLECLESLYRLDPPPKRVIVCDNASTDNSLAYLIAWAEGRLDAYVPDQPLRHLSFPPVVKTFNWCLIDREQAEAGILEEKSASLVLVECGANLGFAGGNNVGLRLLMALDDVDYVWLLNNDTVVESDAMQLLVDEMRQEKPLGICGSTLLYYDQPGKVQAFAGGYYCKWIGLPWLIGRWRNFTERCVKSGRPSRMMNYVVGASMLIPRSYLSDVGLMREDYFLFYEETDWAWRGRGRYELGWAPGSKVYHKVGKSIGTSSNPREKSRICDYYALRNRLLFTRSLCPEALPTVWLSLFCAMIIRVISGRFDLVDIPLKLMAGRDPRGPNEHKE